MNSALRQRYSIDMSVPMIIIGKFLAVCSAILVLNSLVINAGASSGYLQDALNTSMLRGVLSTLLNASWLWTTMQFIITWTCGLSLAITLINFFLIISYKCCQNIFDQVYMIKQEKMNGKFFGIPEFAKSLFDYKGGAGTVIGGGIIDTLIAAALSFLPDIKKIVLGLNRGGEHGDIVKEDDSIIQTTVKVLKATFAQILILCLGFNGSVVRAMGMGIDVITATVDHALEYDMKTIVERKLNSIGGYNFNMSGANTVASRYADKVAIEIYNAILARVNGNYEADFVKKLGSVVEQAVYGEIDCSTDGSITDSFLGRDWYGYETLTVLANAGKVDSYQFREINSEQAVSDIEVDTDIRSTPLPTGQIGMSFDIEKILRAVSDTNIEINGSNYIHVVVSFTRDSNAEYQLSEDGAGNANEVQVEIGN